MIEVIKVIESYEKAFEEVVKTEVKKIASDPMRYFYCPRDREEYMAQLEDLESDDDKKVSTASNFFATKILEEPNEFPEAFLAIEEIMTASYDSIRKIGLRKKDENSLPLIAVFLKLPVYIRVPDYEMSDELFKRLIKIGKSLEGGMNYGKDEAVLTTEQAEEFKNAFCGKEAPDYKFCKDLRYYILRNENFEKYVSALIYDFYYDINAISKCFSRLTTCIAIELGNLGFSNLAEICASSDDPNWTQKCGYRHIIKNEKRIESFLEICYSPLCNDIREDIEILKEMNTIKTFKECHAIIRAQH